MQIVREHLNDGHELAVVVSAMSGVTDLLLDSAAAAAAADVAAYRAINDAIREKHSTVVESLISSEPARSAILSEVNELLGAHIELCEAARILGEVSPRIADALVSFGERLS